jgi:hypothetical protein
LNTARLTVSPGAHGACILAAAIGLLPAVSGAAGSQSFPPRVQSVHELIVEGERPEISACLYSTQLAVRSNKDFERIRWNDSISVESVVREYRLAGDWIRVTEFQAVAMPRDRGLFSRPRWVDVQVECQQVNEKTPMVTLRLKLDKAAQ